MILSQRGANRLCDKIVEEKFGAVFCNTDSLMRLFDLEMTNCVEIFIACYCALIDYYGLWNSLQQTFLLPSELSVCNKVNLSKS
jgi:hypothetical protein